MTLKGVSPIAPRMAFSSNVPDAGSISRILITSMRMSIPVARRRLTRKALCHAKSPSPSPSHEGPAQGNYRHDLPEIDF